jgi:undecaprenyl pyrophosphate phosphatase UppP
VLDIALLMKAVAMGVVEGLTEFLPISVPAPDLAEPAGV